MKNFMDRIECIIEPEMNYCNGEAVRITMMCRSDGKEFRVSKIENMDFLRSHFDFIFDHMRETIKDRFLAEVDDVD
jgi:hypothetical protein